MSSGSVASRWWSQDTLAVVTGGNKGIGYDIVKQLAQHGITTVLTSRDVTRGENATKQLREDGLPVVYHQLDVTSAESARTLASWLKQHHGGVDILVGSSHFFEFLMHACTPMALENIEELGPEYAFWRIHGSRMSMCVTWTFLMSDLAFENLADQQRWYFAGSIRRPSHRLQSRDNPDPDELLRRKACHQCHPPVVEVIPSWCTHHQRQFPSW